MAAPGQGPLVFVVPAQELVLSRVEGSGLKRGSRHGLNKNHGDLSVSVIEFLELKSAACLDNLVGKVFHVTEQTLLQQIPISRF